MKYLLDSNTFIESKNAYYGFDICPGYWDFLVTKEEVVIEKAVYEELTGSNDELGQWVKANKRHILFQPNKIVEESINSRLAEILNWARNSYEEKKFADYAQKLTDARLVATGSVLDWTVVTREKTRLNAFTSSTNKKYACKVMIPDVCAKFNVSCKNHFEMLRELGTQFIYNRK